MEVCWGSTLFPLISRPSCIEGLSIIPKKCWADFSTWSGHLSHPFRVKQYRVLWMGLGSSCPSASAMVN